VAGSSPILAIKIIADASGAIKELDKVGKKTGGFADAVGAAALPAATIVTGLGAMTVAAAKDAAEQQQLAKTYETATGSTEDYSAAIDAAIKAGRDKAFTDTDVRKGLAPLITATGDAEKANEMLGPAMDIARLAGVDLETASEALAKSLAGQNRQLVALLPGMEKVKDPTEQIAIATALAAGAAETYAQTAPGQLLAVTDAYLELGESIGVTFLPLLKEMTKFLGEAAVFLREHMEVVQPLAVVFGALAVAVLAVNVALGILALLASPVVLVALAIAGVIAGIVLLYQNSQTFRDIVAAAFKVAEDVIRTMGDAVLILGGIVQHVFDAIGVVVDTTIAFIRSIFEGVLAFLRDPFEVFQGIVETVFDAVQLAISTVLDVIKGIFGLLGVDLNAPFDALEVVVGQVFDEAERIVGLAIDAIKVIFDGVADILANPFEAFQAVVKGVMDAVLGLVRDAVATIEGIIKGISDAVKTVEDTVGGITPWSAAPPPVAGGPAVAGLRFRGARAGGGAGGGGSTIVNVNVASADPGEVMRAIRRWSRSNGGAGPFTRGLDRSTA
jgi:hypothetical protein